MGRPNKSIALDPQIIELYGSGMTCNEVARQLGISAGTVSTRLKANDVQIEARTRNANAGRTPEQQAEINARISVSRRGKGVGPREGALKRICEECETEYPARSKGTRFCSIACRSAWVSHNQREDARSHYDEDPARCPCGAAIPYENRHTNKYCSTACRTQYGLVGGRSKDPANYVTRTCQNESCAKEFTRYRKYGSGHLKYCSNACASRHTKTRRFYAVENFDIVFESSYEAFFWGACILGNISIERFDRQYGVQWDDNPDHWYAPDFWLPQFELAVEIKGFEDDQDQARWDAYRATGRSLRILARDELVRIRPVDLQQEWDAAILQRLDREVDAL